jgi:hypothetical protein
MAQVERVTITIIVSPSLGDDGRKAHGARGQFFDACLGDRVLVTRPMTPFCDSARVLLAEGTDALSGLSRIPRLRRKLSPITPIGINIVSPPFAAAVSTAIASWSNPAARTAQISVAVTVRSACQLRLFSRRPGRSSL